MFQRYPKGLNRKRRLKKNVAQSRSSRVIIKGSKERVNPPKQSKNLKKQKSQKRKILRMRREGPPLPSNLTKNGPETQAPKLKIILTVSQHYSNPVANSVKNIKETLINQKKKKRRTLMKQQLTSPPN